MEINEILRKFTYGVYVIGVQGEERPNFMTEVWVTRVADQPPLIAVAVSNLHYTRELLAELEQKKGVFGLSLLPRTTSGRECATRCGTASGREKVKISEDKYIITKTGAPVLRDSVAYLSCRLQQSLVLGDHTLFIGEVLCAHEGEALEETPLGRREGLYV